MEETSNDKLSWYDRHRMMTVGIFLLIVWFSLLTFWWLKADAITRDPCSICSEYQGEDVVCRTQTFIPKIRTYYPNGSVYENPEDIRTKRQMVTTNITNFTIPT